MSQFLEHALAGETTTTQEWNDHLIAFHETYGRLTENIIEQMHTPGGETSYDVLASRINALASGARAILDIGCGDGALLVRISQRFGSNVAMSGIDLSRSGIARARERLPAAAFYAGDAVDVNMREESLDVVASHLAFMAMPEIDRVLVRARNALRGSGLLAFVIEDPLGGGTIFELLGSAVAALRGWFPAFRASRPDGEPIERDEVVSALLTRVGFREISIEPFRVCARLSDEQLWRFIEGCYPFGLLEARTRDALHAALRPQIDAAARDPLGVAFGLRLVTAHV